MKYRFFQIELAISAVVFLGIAFLFVLYFLKMFWLLKSVQYVAVILALLIVIKRFFRLSVEKKGVLLVLSLFGKSFSLASMVDFGKYSISENGNYYLVFEQKGKKIVFADYLNLPKDGVKYTLNFPFLFSPYLITDNFEGFKTEVVEICKG